MTPQAQDDNPYAAPAAPIVDHAPPTVLSRFSRVCIRSAACVAALVLASQWLVDGVRPDWARAFMVLACCALPTGWLLWARNRMPGEPAPLAPRRLLLLSIGYSACTLALAVVLMLAGSACITVLMAMAGVRA